MMTSVFESYIATCQIGLEEVLAKEMTGLGLSIGAIGSGIVGFNGDQYDLYRANLGLRCALHILKPLKTIKAKDYNLVYYQARKINWHKLFACDKNIRIDVKGKSVALSHSQYLIHRVKDAILDTFRKFNDERRPSINKQNPDIVITVFVQENTVTLYLDSSGVPLFKRGYRTEHGPAPIKEDLAAGIILLSDWDGRKSVVDIMCGSATFLIEAYYIARCLPPNLNRTFSFMHWFDYSEPVFLKAKKSLEEKMIPSDARFYGFEIDPSTYKTACKILKNLGLQDKIQLENKDFCKIEKKFDDSFIVTNPPYGERLNSDQDLIPLYQSIGDFLKQRCKNSSASIFTANLTAGKFIGLRTSAKIKLFNGPLEGRLLKFFIH